MKKKNILLLILILILITGCTKKDEDKEIFRISKTRDDCTPVLLKVYKDKTYELFTAYEGCIPGEECNDTIRYTKRESGKYKYKIMNIIKNSVDADDKTYDIFNQPLYDIYMSDKYVKKDYAYHYTIEKDTENKYLDEFLKSIDVDLNMCAEAEYFD